MKQFCKVAFAISMVFLISTVHAQITNFKINGSSSTFTMTTGDTITWEFNLPVGTSVTGELWYDVNQNGAIEPATDISYYQFIQTDGDTMGNGGPPDMDGAVNGHMFFSTPIGIAPGKYVFKLTQNLSSVVAAGTVNPLASPVYTVSGHVTPPAGKSAQYILVDLEASGQGMKAFWDVTTDAAGNYTIGMSADTSGQPWRLRVQNNPYPPAVITPSDTTLTITGNHTGYNFTLLQAAAQVAGYVRDENDQPRLDGGASLRRSDTTNFYRRSNLSGGGFFQIGLLSSELQPQPWTLEADMNNPGYTTTELQPHVEIPTIGVGDSLFHILKIYKTNSTIRGQVLLNHVPINWQMQIIAVNRDTAMATAWSDSLTGNFMVPVSDKIRNYEMSVNWIPPNWVVPQIIAHAGDSTVSINIVMQTNVQVAYHPGWNMLSVPLFVQDNHKTNLFPSAMSPAYYYTPGGYRTDSLLQTGRGYWLKYPNYNFSWIYGLPFSQETVAVQAGWNMIAPTSDSVRVSTIVPIGTSILTVYYGYSGSGYLATTTLYPGSGYWVKVNQAGQLVLTSSLQTPQSQPVQTPRAATHAAPLTTEHGVSQIIFKDAAGEERTIFFSTTQVNVDPATYEMPPFPPGGIFDVRFASQRMFETAKPNTALELPITISSGFYPITATWKLSDTRSGAAIRFDGKLYPLRINGEVQITTGDARLGLHLDESMETVVPKAFALDQNFPNPFNPETDIRFQIPDVGDVRLKIYDVLGQEIATLVDELKQPGVYTVSWDAANYASGIYYYRLTAGGFTAIQKMILMK